MFLLPITSLRVVAALNSVLSQELCEETKGHLLWRATKYSLILEKKINVPTTSRILKRKTKIFTFHLPSAGETYCQIDQKIEAVVNDNEINLSVNKTVIRKF